MMHKKNETVNTDGMKPEMWFALGVVDSAYAAEGMETIITSAADSVHNPGSKHGQGLAVDVRNGNLTEDQKTRIWAKIQRLEKYGYDCVNEVEHATVATTGTHFHIEYDPKPGERSTLFG